MLGKAPMGYGTGSVVPWRTCLPARTRVRVRDEGVRRWWHRCGRRPCDPGVDPAMQAKAVPVRPAPPPQATSTRASATARRCASWNASRASWASSRSQKSGQSSLDRARGSWEVAFRERVRSPGGWDGACMRRPRPRRRAPSGNSTMPGPVSTTCHCRELRRNGEECRSLWSRRPGRAIRLDELDPLGEVEPPGPAPRGRGR